MPVPGEWIAVAGGGALGALLRYGATVSVARWLPGAFPWGTLAVNVAGSLLMGIAVVLLTERGLLTPAWRTFVTVGLLGGFTTFSAFSLDALNLLGQGALLRAGAYVLVSVVICIAAAALGVLLARGI